MLTRVKNEFHAVLGQNRHFRIKPSPRVNMSQTMSTGIKNEFQVILG
jgi:hypothetical protein